MVNKNVPLGALLVQNARTALLATDGGTLLEGNAHRAVAARVPHDAAAAAVAVVVGGAGGEALGVGDLVLLAGRHFDVYLAYLSSRFVRIVPCGSRWKCCSSDGDDVVR